MVAAPQELILLAMRALLKPGDHVVCAFPGYQSLYECALDAGCDVTRWEPDEKKDWRFDPETLKRLLRPSTKLIVVNFPHNPTGALASQADFKNIVDLAHGRGIHLFSDEMYRMLELDPADRLPSACELYDRAVSLFGMSKSFGLAGLRLGWLVVRDKALYRRLCELKDYSTICSSAPSEILSLIGLRARERILERHRARLRRNLDLLDGFFAARRDSFSWIRPKAGTIGFAGLLLPERPLDFAERCVRESGVMLLPSDFYEYPSPHLRIGFGRENMPDALDRFETFLNASRR